MPGKPRRPASAQREKPVWREQDGQLRWRGKVVLQFSRPAENQRAILRAFQRARWRTTVRVTLPGPAYGSAKRRLHDAVKWLNREQHALRFHGDGTGYGVRWEPVKRRRS